ncbi:MAG: Z1 domain-containing protein [Parasphingorhabdus sp.]|uniref:Z1 domain-containing protein n=1 Tax=Parasphingorhabdus sp. TaxID=2709688 RepID=UPI003296DD6A
MDWSTQVGNVGNDQYDRRIEKLKQGGIDTSSIEKTVNQTIGNLKPGCGSSFVIFGEPQSGKTEMMIALNAKLLDEGRRIIVNLLTDSVDLLGQSLGRFRKSGLSPSPKNFDELPPNAKELKGKKWVIFCKKNARNLENLIELLRHESDFVIIDDEADYASPNAKVNKDAKTRINELITDLIGSDGHYIGVTATPARLNLNNTFDNVSELWIDFEPHPEYVGQDFFFPGGSSVGFKLHTFDIDEGSEKAELENAILNFLCGVAVLHKKGVDKNFTMLVHTSGKKDDHAEDMEVIHNTISALSNPTLAKFDSLVKRLEKVAVNHDAGESVDIVKFVLNNIDKNLIVEINSNKSSGKVADVAEPTSLFSFGAGGNIISRGVTFSNLLSMYFTRSVKGKFSQDTYIQRARMFGARNAYKEHFQLWIPKELLANWNKCFEFHKLAIEAMKSEAGAPVWLSDHKTTPTSSASIDRSSVDFEGGEMSFALFDFDESLHNQLMNRDGRTDKEMIESLGKILSKAEFPEFVQQYLINDVDKHKSKISFHKPSSFGTRAKTYSDIEKANVRRDKGIFATNEYARSERPTAKHHLKIFFNETSNARLFYKINGKAIQFMHNNK